DVAFVAAHRWIRRAQRHRPFGERAIDGVLRRRAELDPVVAETSGNTAGDHSFESFAARFEADAVTQVGVRAHVLKREQIAILMVHARETVADELLRDVREAVPAALRDLRRGECLATANLVEHGARAIRHPAVQTAVLITVERAAPRVLRG